MLSSVCLSITISLGVRAYSNAYFGRGTGPILMAYVGCRGEETHLANCSRSTSSCSHWEDAGVRCPGTAYRTALNFRGSTFSRMAVFGVEIIVNSLSKPCARRNIM